MTTPQTIQAQLRGGALTWAEAGLEESEEEEEELEEEEAGRIADVRISCGGKNDRGKKQRRK